MIHVTLKDGSVKEFENGISCLLYTSHSADSLRCFSLRPVAKPDSARLMPRQRAAQYSFTVPLFPGRPACFLSAGHCNSSTIRNIWHILYGIAV